MNITGHHHISMITKDGQQTNRFYKDILGMRRVKKTVNQEDTSMYHLFYGDLTGSPGTELSFFEIPMVGKTYRGTDAITRIGIFVPSRDSLDFWEERFAELSVEHGEITSYAGRDALHFEDHEGLRMVLINLGNEDVPEHWETWQESSIPQQHRILGMGPVEITVRSLEKLAETLEHVFNYELVSRNENEALYQSMKGHGYGEIVIVEKDGVKERPGKGSVHHVAIRVKDGQELRAWDERIRAAGFVPSKIVDRYYFESLYFREHNNILFELATDGPGFTVDSTVEELGRNLDLPPFLEGKRAEIEAKLMPID